MKTSVLPSPLHFLLCGTLWMALSLVAPLKAQDSPSGSGDCTVTVLEIVAENTGQGLAEELKSLQKDLERLNYTTYRLNNTHETRITFSQPHNLTLLGDHSLVLTAEGTDDNGMIRLKVKLSPKGSKDKALETLMRIPDGGTFLIGGPSHGKGVLILAFTARK